jgi:hypothetical protein
MAPETAEIFIFLLQEPRSLHYRFSPYLTENTMRLHCKTQLVNIVQGNNRSLLSIFIVLVAFSY